VVLSDTPAINGHRPSVDVLFHSVAQEFGPTAVGVLMTGMGEDGAEGLGAMKSAGGMTIAQSEETCVVSGMPHAAITKGYVTKILPLETLGAFLIGQYGNEHGGSERSDGHEKPDKTEKMQRFEKTPVSTPRA
jgi:two-component system, chemotaxis family, protein-glutamate methylesterase/glutaminase